MTRRVVASQKTEWNRSFKYARDGSSVKFMHDEEWCLYDHTNEVNEATYDIDWGREFRYDGARQKYLVRELEPEQLETSVIAPRTGDCGQGGRESFFAQATKDSHLFLTDEK